MARVAPAISSLNAGELAPTLEGRTDISKYGSGCRLMENFVPLIQGPAERRGGTRFVAEVKNSAHRTWLRRFEFSASQAYILEFGHQYIRFFTNHGQVLSGLSEYEVSTPYVVTDLADADGGFALKIEQSGDVLYIAGAGAYPPMTLTRLAATNWVLAEYQPDHGPFLEQNTDTSVVLWASARTGSVTIRSNGTPFASTDVDRLVMLRAQNPDVAPWEADTQTDVTAGALRSYNGRTYKALNTAKTGTSPPTHSAGVAKDGEGTGIGVYWEYQDAGYGIARITAYTSASQVTATVLLDLPAAVVGSTKTITGATAANPVVISSAAHGIPDASTVYIYGVVGMTQLNNRFFRTEDAASGTFELSQTDGSAYTAYSSGGTAVVNATARWSLGAWSETSGYPTAVAFAYDRLWWAAGLTLWGSQPGLYDEFATDDAGLVTADMAITRTLSAQDVNEILWLIEADRLLIGTAGGEFALGQITSVDPLGPENVQIKRQSKRRCRATQPVLVGTSVLYVQKAGRKLLKLDYSFDIDRYRSDDQTVLAPHITRSGVVDVAYQSEPHSILWCALDDGSLRGFTLEEAEEVKAWHRHPIGGSGVVESVESIPHPNRDADELWLIVRRTINGQTKRYVEYMERPYEDGDDQEDVFYVDSGLTYDGAPVTSISGLDHLEGQTVQVVADGASHPDRTVSGGSIALARSASVVQVGLACPARLVTMRLEAGAQDGTAQGKIKRIHKAVVRLLNTLGGYVGMYGRELEEIQYRRPSMAMDAPPPLFSGDKELTINGDWETDGCVEIRQEQPFPMTVVGVYPRMQTNAG